LKPVEKRLLRLQQRMSSLFFQEDLQGLAAAVTAICKEVFDVIHVAVFFYTEKWNELAGRRPGDEEDIRFPKGEGLAGVVAEERECLLVEDVSESPVYKEAIDGVVNYTPHDILSAPMIASSGELTGVVQLVDKKHGAFSTDDEDMLKIFCTQAAEAVIRCRQIAELKDFAKSLVENVSYSVDAKYASTVAHTWRVRDMAVALARAMNLSEEFVENVEYAALLHAVGRLAYTGDISDLDPEVEKRRNLLFTDAVIRDVKFPDRLSKVKNIVLHCHERIDGTGMPDGLKGKDIPLGSRLIAVCDAFDTLFFQGNDEVPQFDREAALGYLKRNAETLFDSEVVKAFVENRIYEKEKRRHKRIEYTGEVEVTVIREDGTDGETFSTQLLDMSSGGVLFFSRERLGLNVMLKLRILLVTGAVNAVVRTARVFENPEKGGFNIGAYFIWSSSRNM